MRIAMAAALLMAAQDVTKDELRDGLGDAALRGAWVYDDLEAARAEARTSGKPILALARCVS
jgi:hypothetical protein